MYFDDADNVLNIKTFQDTGESNGGISIARDNGNVGIGMIPVAGNPLQVRTTNQFQGIALSSDVADLMAFSPQNAAKDQVGLSMLNAGVAEIYLRTGGRSFIKGDLAIGDTTPATHRLHVSDASGDDPVKN